jgi:polar amino acid transport system substrate-binding protein
MRPAGARLFTSTLLLATLALAGCSSADVVPDTAAAPSPSVSTGAASAGADCTPEATASYPPLAASETGLMERIKKRRLVVGVSSDSYLLGALRAGTTAEFEGFDIDMAREVARSLTGSPDNIQFKVITAADRIAAVDAGAERGGVDLVARNMTMTCDRWKQVNFSAVYFDAGQRVLVRGGATETSLADLGKNGRTVCAPKGSTSLAAVPRLAPGAVPYAADQHTACLALLQEGTVDAITGDDTVLAGLVAQEPGTKVVGERLSDEPYGLAVDKDHPEFARYVNSVLARVVRDGTWKRSYDKWFGTTLGPASPPKPNYDRPLP